MRVPDVKALVPWAVEPATDEQLALEREEILAHTKRFKREEPTERGHSKDGMVGMGTLGALRVVGRGGRWDGVRFNVGSGFDAATRAAIWADRAGWEGRLVKFKFFPIGSKEAPRFPIFLGERHPDDT